MISVRDLAIPAVKEIVPERFADERGWLSETYNREALARAGVDLVFVQDNRSFSAEPGTVRGLHYQSPPMAQDKLVSVPRGAIFDVALDLRIGSPTFGRHVGLEIGAALGNQMLVPKGFAHGFVTLAPETEVIYKMTAHHSPAHAAGILWNDRDLGIVWPLGGRTPVVSEKDGTAPRLRDVVSPFA